MINNSQLEDCNNMADLCDIIASRRERVLQAYNSAKAENHNCFLEGDVNATAEYIFPNQLEDANAIVQKFYKDGRRIISVQKLTKIGADGLMIEILKIMATHPDDNFVSNPANARILTGMSNVKWEEDMKNKAPAVFKDKIFHHGKLNKAELQNMNNSIIIIDEIDTGDKKGQRLDTLLKESGILNVKHMIEHNNRFVVISATIIKELYAMYQWGDLHDSYKMTVPPSYIGHSDFLKRGIIKEFYPLNTNEEAERWVKEDIIDNYGTAYRIHFVRVNKKTAPIIQAACIKKGIMYRDHTSTDILTKEEEKEFFEEPLTHHIVLAVKGFYRRANLIPNKWKLRIGATHELYKKTPDNNTEVQALPGRMSGHWRKEIETGHKTGPHRTSCKAIEEYEKIYNDPFGRNSYTTAGFTKRKGKVLTSELTLLSPENIEGLEAVDLPDTPAAPQSKAIVILKLDDSNKDIIESNIRNINEIMKLIKKLDKETYKMYKKYNARCWQMNTPDKCSKWGLDRMKEKGAVSTETNIHENEKETNVLMIYYHPDGSELIISPWNGASAEAKNTFADADEVK